MKRHQDALYVQGGACNLLAITSALLSAVKEAREEGKRDHQDEAVRLIIHQMYHLSCCSQLDDGLLEYERCLATCEKEAL